MSYHKFFFLYFFVLFIYISSLNLLNDFKDDKIFQEWLLSN